MNAEKTAVLVVTGIVAVLLATTLARSRPEGKPLESTDHRKKSVHRQDQPPKDPFVRIRSGGGGSSPAPRPRPPDPTPGPSGSYRIKPDDNFESIALEVYGRRSFAHLLAKANPSFDPRLLRIGTEIIVPPRPKHVKPIQGQRPVRSDDPPEGWHLVRHGERLETIARAHYGRRSAWKRIYDANRDQLRNPHRIREGMRLRLP